MVQSERNQVEGKTDRIKVLGGGCSSCQALLTNTKTAVKRLGWSGSVQVEYITDMEQVMSYGIMQMPLLVVDERVISYGKVLTAGQIETLLRKQEA